jgi:ATP-dependent DNA ligase
MSVAFRELERRIKRSVTFEPCLPKPAKEPPSGPGWLHEIKHDGFRIVAQKEGERVRLISGTATTSLTGMRLLRMPS